MHYFNLTQYSIDMFYFPIRGGRGAVYITNILADNYLQSELLFTNRKNAMQVRYKRWSILITLAVDFTQRDVH